MKAILSISLVLVSLIFISCNKNDLSSTISSPDDFFQKYEKPSEFFTVDISQNQWIWGERGTGFLLKSGKFEDSNGKVVTGNIDVEIKEIYSKSDMIFSNKPTQSNGWLLESGGVFYFAAYQNGERLECKDLLIQAPTQILRFW